jgi:spore coat polysaccharide biosynthesis protein SpsF
MWHCDTVPRTVAIIQARNGSRRLPRKSLAPVLGRPLLDLMLERVERASTLSEIVLATTTAARDDELVTIARRRGVTVFRGSEPDVLSRYVGAAAVARAELVVRLTADCPLIDPDVIDHVVRVAQRTLGEDVDLVTNAPHTGRTYPDGMDVEVFTAQTLTRVDELATAAEDREHVTLRLHRAPFHHAVVDLSRPAGEVRITVDYQSDLDRVRAIFEDLYPRSPTFGLQDVLDWGGGDWHLDRAPSA